MEWTEVVPHLTGQAHMATVRPDGSPHVARVWPAVDGDTIWIGTRATSGKARNLRVHPGAALMYESDGEAYVFGDADVVTDLDTKQRVWNSGIFPYPMEGFFGAPERDDFVFLRITPRRAIVMTQADAGIRRDSWELTSD